MSLNESTDCKIEKIIRSNAHDVVALVSTRLEPEQMRYFQRNQDYLTTDLHSTKARLGINQEKLNTFELKNNKISYEIMYDWDEQKHNSNINQIVFLEKDFLSFKQGYDIDIFVEDIQIEDKHFDFDISNPEENIIKMSGLLLFTAQKVAK